MIELEKVDDMLYAIAIGQDLKRNLQRQGIENEWKVSNTQIYNHIEEIKKLYPNSIKYLDFMQENDVITPTKLGLQKMLDILKKMKKKGLSTENEIKDFKRKQKIRMDKVKNDTFA